MIERCRIPVLLLAALAIPRASSDERWQRIEAPLAVEWPRDHGAHPQFRTEWWYATGELADETGRAFGYQLTIFRQGLDASQPREGESQLRARHVLAAHLALVDVQSGRCLCAQRLRRAGSGLAEARSGDLSAWLEDWRMSRTGTDEIACAAFDREATIGVDLALASRKAIVMHGADGTSKKGAEPGNASAYMSWTRLATRGTITLGDRSFQVQGESWFDHEWGTSQLGAGIVGWDWFGLRLDDGREVMIYRLRAATGESAPATGGTIVERDGSARTLAREEFSLESLATWTSPRTKAAYPSRWKLRIPAAHVSIEIEPRAADCELDTRASTGTIYWEGPVSVHGSSTGGGYAELTGYAGALTGRF